MKTILIVDDDERIQKIYYKLFSREGFRIIKAYCATEANGILVKEKVDVMLLDINMPKVDGLSALRVMRQTNPNLACIIISAEMSDRHKEQAPQVRGQGDHRRY